MAKQVQRYILKEDKTNGSQKVGTFLELTQTKTVLIASLKTFLSLIVKIPYDTALVTGIRRFRLPATQHGEYCEIGRIPA